MDTIGILIKPDVHERGLYKDLINDFISLGYEIALEQDILMSAEDVEFLYPESYKIPAGKRALMSYLENKKSTIVLFHIRENRKIDHEIAKLQDIKGKKELRTGLRYKYNDMPITDAELTDKSGNYYKYMMINLFHVFDDTEQLTYFINKYVKA